MNSQRNLQMNQFTNQNYQRPISTASQVQNPSMVNIKPLSIPCRYHPDQICQNYCVQAKCFQALCSECIEQHLLHHKKQGLNDLYVKSFKSVRIECSGKLMKIVDKLLSKLGILHQPKNPQEMLDETDKQLQSIRLHMHQVIQQQFLKIRQSIKQRLNQNFSIVKQLSQIHQNLLKIINQLKQHNTIISQGIVDSQVNVGDSIEKTILLNETALIDMFQKEGWKYEQKFKNINVDVVFSQNEFRQAVLSSLKMGASSNSNNIFNKNSKNSYSTIIQEDNISRLRSRSRSPINDKNLQSSTLGIAKKSSPTVANYPILHYFETGQNVLHIVDIKSDPPVKSSISLSNFTVPNFHSSILSQKFGFILISGGNIEHTSVVGKSSLMSKFSLSTSDFKKDFAIIKPRSSHTMCEDLVGDCVYILGGYGELPQQGNDQSLTKFETTVQKISLKSGNTQQIASSNWGGACIAIMTQGCIIKACMQGIQLYDTSSSIWSRIRNVKGTNVEGVFCRGAGYSLLNANSILIYGGYDQNEQSRKQCYLMNLNINERSIQDSLIQVQQISSTLPIAQGFWNNPGILFQNQLWAIQNIEDEEGLPVECQRNLVRLDLQKKLWNNVKMVNNKGKR